MTTIKRYLVVRADGNVRIAQRPKLAADEVAVRLDINIPPGWGRVATGAFTVDMPAPPAVADLTVDTRIEAPQ